MNPAEINKRIAEACDRLKTQDNRITENPMFCLQKLVRDVGYDTTFACNKCWLNSETEETIYDDDEDFKKEPEGDGWDEFGYVDRWEDVMVAFTEKALLEYMDLNGHNVNGFKRKTRIYVKSFNRCPEMIAIREKLLGLWEYSK